MTPPRCTHCGKPVFTGYLCSECQALRASQPHLFLGDASRAKDRTGFRWDSSAIFCIALLVALAICGIIFGPTLFKKATQSGTSVADNNSEAAKVVSFGKNYAETLKSNMSDSDTLAAPAPPNRKSPSAPAPQIPTKQGAPHVYPMPMVSPPAETVDTPGDWEKSARSTLDPFLSDYCRQRGVTTGEDVKVVNVSWLPGGAGAIISIDENGSGRQGTAQFNPKTGWSWLIEPDSKTEGH